QKLSSAGATLVQANMEELNSLKEIVKGAHFIFVVTDFLGAEGNSDRELKQGLNVIEAASSPACLDTLEALIWSSLPDARKQPCAYENIVHFNSKRAISDRLWNSPLRSRVTEVWLAAYYENFVNSWGIYEPMKQNDGSYVLKYPMDADSKIPFMSVTDLGKLITVIIEDPIKYHTKVVSFVSEWRTPLELLESFRKATGVEAKFQSMTTEQFKKHLETVLHFPSNVALSMSENLSCYRTNPNMITDHTDYAAKDLLQGLKTWDDFVRDQDWKSYLASK
ncbi:NmrA-like family domain-containing protein, partial [Lachnellula subtilissima]